MPSPSRRALLGVLAALATGCIGQTNPPGDTLTETTSTASGPSTESSPRTATDDLSSPSPSPETTVDAPNDETPPPRPTVDPDAVAVPLGETVDGVTVADTRLRPAVVVHGVHSDVRYPDEGQQFLLVRVSVDGDAPRPGRFGAVTAASATLSDGFDASSPGSSADEADLAFPLSVGATDAAAVVWSRPTERDVRWELPDAVVSDLADAPSFEVRAFEVPDTASEEESVEVCVVVANVGDEDGTFLAELGSDAVSDQSEARLHVPAGETATLRTAVTVRFFDSEEAGIVLRWRETLRRTVTRR